MDDDNHVDVPVTLLGVQQADVQLQKILEGFKNLIRTSDDMASRLELRMGKINELLAKTASFTNEIAKIQKTITAGTPQYQLNKLATAAAAQPGRENYAAMEAAGGTKLVQAQAAQQDKLRTNALAFVEKMQAEAVAARDKEYLLTTAFYDKMLRADAAYVQKQEALRERLNLSATYSAAGNANRQYDKNAVATNNAMYSAALQDNKVFDRSSAGLSKYIRDLHAAGMSEEQYGQQVVKTNQAIEKSASRFSQFFGVNLADTIKVQAGFILSYKAIQTLFDAIHFGTKFIVDFNQALYDLQAITASSDSDMSILKKRIEEVSQTTHFSAVEIAGAAKILGQAGYSTQQVGEALQGVVTLATASGDSLENSANTATAAIAQFKLQTTDMLHVANVMVDATNKAKLTMPQLSIALSYAGTAASDAGLTFEQTTAVIAAMSSTIKNGSKIGTGLADVLIAIVNPSKKLTDALKEVHLTVKDLQTAMAKDGMQGVLDLLNPKVFSLEKAFEAFGNKAGMAFIAMQQGRSQITGLEKDFKDTSAATEAAATQMKGFADAWGRFTGSVGVFLEKQGGDFLIWLTKVLDGMSTLVQYMSHMPNWDKILGTGEYNPITRQGGLLSHVDNADIAVYKAIHGKEPDWATARQYQVGGQSFAPGSQSFAPRSFSGPQQSSVPPLTEEQLNAMAERNLKTEEDNQKFADSIIKGAQTLVKSTESMFTNLNNALEVQSKHLDNLLSESADINSPLYGKYNDAEASMFKKRQREIAVQELQNQVDYYPERLATLGSLLAKQQQSAALASSRVAMSVNDKTLYPKELAASVAEEKGVTETKEKIVALTQEQTLAQDKLNASLGIGAEANATLREQMEFVLQNYSKTMNVQSQFTYNLQKNVTDALDNARASFSQFTQDVLSGTKSVGASFRDMAASILQSILKMESDQLAMSIFGKITGWASGLFGASSVDTIAVQDVPVPGVGTVKSYNGGGLIRAANGTFIGRDNQLVLAQQGEGILRRSAMDMIGKDTFNQLNAMGNRKISQSASAMGSMPTPVAPAHQEVNVWVIPPTEKPSLTKNDVLVTLQEDILKGGNTKKLIKSVQQGTF